MGLSNAESSPCPMSASQLCSNCLTKAEIGVPRTTRSCTIEPNVGIWCRLPYTPPDAAWRRSGIPEKGGADRMMRFVDIVGVGCRCSNG